MSNQINNIVAKTFLELSNALQTGNMDVRPVIALTGIGSELGEDNAIAGALEARQAGVDVVYIGMKQTKELCCIPVCNEDDAHNEMLRLLDSGKADGAVTMHYPFPVGVATVGRVATPARGKVVYLATTTGTSATTRVEGMVRNAVAGVIAAKACGNAQPLVGIANLDGAALVESDLKKLASGGYPMSFAKSERSDGGCILRGNDILAGTADVIITDSLTGNIIIKMLSAFTTGGSYESVGWGYGPGIGMGYDRLVMIVSRLSGSPVIAGALIYAGMLKRGGWREIAAAEYAAANKAGLEEIISSRNKSQSIATAHSDERTPQKEPVTEEITGIDIMSLENAVNVLLGAGIYAESGMGCTGPIVLVTRERLNQSLIKLKAAGYIE
ncbi:MAG: glycine/sarcosine/betaine reductase complex component C subunit alpha [Oscillospiraceae bacterium]|nr:glycine/sarcosine/betaine reductase complex component C subunit alpha [Oscillospiraceae bacterium]